jgi:serine/threonine-protein kinase
MRFEDEWLAGQRPAIEPVLAAFPVAGREELLTELLLLEWTYRHQGDESFAPEQYGQRFGPMRPVVHLAWQQWEARWCGSPAGDARAGGPGAPTAPGEVRLLDYESAHPVGQGGMGEVHKAFDPRLKRWVALKQVRLEQIGPERLARFRQEAEALARLQHPHIVKVHGYAEREGQPALEMEYVAGGTLEERLGHHALEPGEAARLVAILAWAVHAAHEKGIVHRDLKPANVLMDDPVAGDAGNVLGGFPKVSDFGLAALTDRSSGQTHSGAVLGTPAYMSPEQAAGKTREVGPATDVWALGVILYRCLAGTLPFQGDSVLDTLERVKTMQMRPLQDACPEAPRDLEEACMACLRKDPGTRPTAAELATRLNRFAAGALTPEAPSLPQREWGEPFRSPSPEERRSPFPSAVRTSAPVPEGGMARPTASGAPRLNPAREPATVEIVLDRQFKDFKREDQDELLEGFRRILCVVGEIKVISVRPGSVILTLELDPEDAQRLLQAAREGKLAEFALVSAKLVETTAPGPGGGDPPIAPSVDSLIKPASRLGWRPGPLVWWGVAGGLVGLVGVANLLLVVVWLVISGWQPGQGENPSQHPEPGNEPDKVAPAVNPAPPKIDPIKVAPETTPANPRPVPPSDLYERLLKSVCWIITTTTPSEGTLKTDSGSGTLIDRDERLVVTTADVAPNRERSLTVLFPLVKDGKLVTSNKEYRADYQAGKGIKARVVSVDPRRGLSLIQLERLPEGLEPARLARRWVRAGQRVHSMSGNPPGNQRQWIYSYGAVRQAYLKSWKDVAGRDCFASLIASDLPAEQGDSGGGLFTDDGRLVGVNCTSFKDSRNTSWYIDVDEADDCIRSYFRSIRKWWRPPDD